MQSLALIGTDRLKRIGKAEAQLDFNDRQDLAALGQDVDLALRGLEPKAQDPVALEHEPSGCPKFSAPTALTRLHAALGLDRTGLHDTPLRARARL